MLLNHEARDIAFLWPFFKRYNDIYGNPNKGLKLSKKFRRITENFYKNEEDARKYLEAIDRVNNENGIQKLVETFLLKGYSPDEIHGLMQETCLPIGKQIIRKIAGKKCPQV